VLDSLDGSQEPLTNILWEGGGLCCWDTAPHTIDAEALCHDIATICLCHQDVLEELHSTTAGITKAAAATSAVKVMAGSVTSTFST